MNLHTNLDLTLKQMDMTLSNGFCEVLLEEMLLIDDGAWDWKEFGKSVGTGAVSGAASYAFFGWW